MLRRTLLVALATPALLPGLARAQESRPIRLVVPFPPGATNDNVGRTLARALSPRLGVTVVVENRAGAGGAVGARQVAESRPDGTTLLNASAGNLVIAPHLSPVGYDPLKDLAPIGFSGEAFGLVAIHPDLPVRNIGEFIAYARRHPGKLNYASAGIGSNGHLRGALLAEEAGLDMVHVPFPGSAPAATSVVTGDCHLMIDPITAPHVRGGRLRGLATVGDVRWEDFPDLPTLREEAVGLRWPGGGWFAVFAPGTTPAPILDRLHEAFNGALAEPEVETALRRFGLRPQALSQAEIRARVAEDHASIGQAIRRLHLA